MVQSKLKTMVYISLLVAQALVIGLIENMIPYPFGFAPGAKMGLANLITIIETRNDHIDWLKTLLINLTWWYSFDFSI